MNSLTVRSLYFIKGLNYEGVPFSIFGEGYPKLSVFPEMCATDLEAYAISAAIGNGVAAVLGAGSFQKTPIEHVGQRLANKCNESSNKGVFVQVVSCMDTSIELVHQSDVGKKLDPANLKPVPKENPSDGRFILYYEKDGLTIGFLQHEFDRELAALEREAADNLGVLILKNESTFSVDKVASAISIETDERDIWLNRISISMSGDMTITHSDADLMVDSFLSKSLLSKNLDGLLLLQSLGYNTKTPYAQFMSLWVVVEKIVLKSFKELSVECVYNESKKNIDILNERTVEHVVCAGSKSSEKIDKMKFSLVDKLIISTSAVGIELDEKTIALFRNIKKIRNDVHEKVCENGAFPLESVFHILRKLCI